MTELLTEEQLEKLTMFRKQAQTIGFSTEPADWETAETALREFYELAGFPPPQTIHRAASPLHARTIIKSLENGRELSYSPTFEGQFQAWFNNGFRFCTDVLGVKLKPEQEKYLDITCRLDFSAGPCYIFDEFAVICDRPEKIFYNEMYKLHNPDGPAVAYRDGFCEVHSINGYQLSTAAAEKIIYHPESITVKDIREEYNSEIARMMVEKYGLEKYLMETGVEVLDVDTLTLKGSAVRTLVRDDKGFKWLIGSDGSTERTYNMAVPEEVTTCRDAHNAICGFDETRMIAEA